MKSLITTLLLGTTFFSLGVKDTHANLTTTLKKKFNELRWVCYAPTNFNPDIGRFPSESSIREDLQTLYNYGFRGIVTYGADGTLSQVPRIAKEVGLQGVIMGIWDINRELEFQNAIAASPYVDGYCVGNEGLYTRYNLDQLEQSLNRYRAATGKPVSTAEQMEKYNPRLFNIGDWAFPNVHPWWHGVRDPINALNWTVKQFLNLQESSGGKYVIIKELGFPTGGDQAASEENQATYYRTLQSSGINFFYFEAFDGPWKTWAPVEPHWGLFQSNRSPKLFMRSPQVIFTYVPPYGSFNDLSGITYNANPTDFRVVAYIYVPMLGWWIKPHVSTLTPIDPNGTWTIDITTGGIDEQATDIVVFVVPSSYDPPTKDRKSVV